MKHCSDCKFSQWKQRELGFYCYSPQRPFHINSLDVKEFVEARPVMECRGDETACGFEAKWFEDKHATT